LKGQGGTVYQVVHLLPAHVKANAAVYMYYPQRSRMPMRVRYFIEFMVRRKWTAFI
jgi:DNA-binding transcriptional LysR family regulator